MNESIKIDSIFLNFGDVKILRGVSFEFKQNKVTGLLGRNGCGKSCLLKIITGQINPAHKHLKYNGKLLLNLYKERGLINYLPQHEFHPKSLKIKQLLGFYNIAFPTFLDKYPFFKKNITQKFSTLSGGEKRLLEVLLVLEAETKFSILDEPFSHIMPKHIGLVKTRINELKSKKGILITDHQYKNVIEISDHIFILNEGSVKAVEGEEDLKFYNYVR